MPVQKAARRGKLTTRAHRKNTASSPSRSKNLPPAPSLAASLGPSFILLGLALGSGELILWPYLAANFGLGLLWGGLLGITLQFVLNTEVMRYSLAWGESVFVGFRRLSILIPVWYIFSTFIPWSLPGFSSAASSILSTILPFMPEKAVAVGLLLLTGVGLTLGKTLYKTMEWYQKAVILLGLPFVLVLAMLLTSRTDWLELGWGLVGKGDGWWFFPQGVALASFLGAFAYSGAGGNLNLAQSYYIKEKGMGMGAFTSKITSLFSPGEKTVALEGATFVDSALNRSRWQAWWNLVNREHFIIFWVLGFVTIVAMAILAKATVYGLEVGSGLSFLYAEAGVITARTNQAVGTFFLLVAAMMLFSTQVGVLESSSRIISENVLLLFHRKGRKYNVSLWFYVALWAQIGLGIVIYLAGFQEPRLLLTLGAVLNAAAMLSSFIFIFVLNQVRLKPEHRPGRVRKLLMLTAVIFFGVFLFLTAKDFFVW